jgi:hypothetical protein
MTQKNVLQPEFAMLYCASYINVALSADTDKFGRKGVMPHA